MKSIIVLASVLMLSFTTICAQQIKTENIKVWGNCGMCKSRIEKAVKQGVQSAAWDTETKVLVVQYDPSKITSDQIHQKIAAVGHDTEKFSAKKEVYEKLPGCCLYERKGAEAATKQK